MHPAVERALHRVPVAGLITGLVAASLGLVAGRTVGRARAVDVIDTSTLREAQHRVTSLTALLDQAATVHALVADDPVFTELLDGTGEPDRIDATLRRRAGEALAKLGVVGADLAVAEACVIDESGRELVRVVNGHIAALSELAEDKSPNLYFRTAMRAPAGTVVRSVPYRSPDTGDLVLATAVPLHAHGRRAIVHVEVRADRVRSLLSAAPRTWLLNAPSGDIVLDGATPLTRVDPPAIARTVEEEHEQPWGASAASSAAADVANRPFGALALAPGARRVVEHDGHRVVLLALPAGPSDDRRLVVAVQSSARIGALTGFNGLSTLLVFVGLAGTGVGVANRRRARAAQLRAERDELTGLGNRRLLMAELEQSIDVARATGRSFSLAMIDLDQFKEVNDTLGHDAGDHLLVEVADRLRRHCRSSDVVTRLGGDEFAAILADTSTEADARLAADRLLEVFRSPVELGDVPVTVRASVGLAAYPADGTEPSALLRCADVAMYRAKTTQAGMERYDAEADPHNADRLRLLAHLRKAIDDGDIWVAYQPVVDAATGEVTSCEALARWTHETMGFISPGEFIPLAETFGLMRPLTRLVLRKALTAMTAWLEEGLDLSVAVNLSATSLVEADCAQQVSRALRAHGVAPHRLTLEVTESAVIADPRRAQVTLEALHRIGVQLAVDDYGTGNASIGYLRTMPFDVVKIDRSFVSGVLENPADRAIVRSTIELSRDLGLGVLAEGVETAEEQAALVRLGCTKIQGYFHSKPLAGPAFVDWLKARNAARAGAR